MRTTSKRAIYIYPVDQKTIYIACAYREISPADFIKELMLKYSPVPPENLKGGASS